MGPAAATNSKNIHSIRRCYSMEFYLHYYECRNKYQSISDHKGTYAMVNLYDIFCRCVPLRNKLEREL